MRSVSDSFLRAVRGSHDICVRARVLTSYQSGVNPTGVEIPVIDGDVVQDGTADVRSTVELDTTADWPANAFDLLTPYGNELYVERGIDYGETREFVGLGYFRINDVEQERAPKGPIRLSGSDRMIAIKDARLLFPVQFPAGITVGEVITDLIIGPHGVYPDAIIDYDDGTTTSGDVLDRSHVVEEDRFAFIDDLVTSRGKIWYWDHRGRLQIKSPPNPADTVFEVNAGEGGVLMEMSRALTREGVYNGVGVRGEATDTIAPSLATVADLDPNSPTYWYGRFGHVPRFYSSPFVTTHAQAVSAATAILLPSLGLPYQVDFSMVPNTALEPYDPIRVKYGRAYRSEVHTIDRLRMSLAPQGAMTGTTKEKTTFVVGEI